MAYGDYYAKIADNNNRPQEDQWHKYICEYYDVTPEQALKLGTRASGRKPDLPGSKTCDPVNDMTYEDIWALESRKSLESIYKFYVDQGAWSSFRQTVRHLELSEMRKNLMMHIAANDMHFVEYGCGIAPFSTTLLQNINPSWKIDVSLTDVLDCEHYTYGQWVLNKIKEERGLDEIEVHAVPAVPNALPKYHKPIDALMIFEVLEHIPSPVATLENIIDQMSPRALIIENFIKHDHDDEEESGCDLRSAASERGKYYEILNNNFTLLAGPPEYQDHGATRIWIRKG